MHREGGVGGRSPRPKPPNRPSVNLAVGNTPTPTVNRKAFIHHDRSNLSRGAASALVLKTVPQSLCKIAWAAGGCECDLERLRERTIKQTTTRKKTQKEKIKIRKK